MPCENKVNFMEGVERIWLQADGSYLSHNEQYELWLKAGVLDKLPDEITRDAIKRGLRNIESPNDSSKHLSDGAAWHLSKALLSGDAASIVEWHSVK